MELLAGIAFYQARCFGLALGFILLFNVYGLKRFDGIDGQTALALSLIGPWFLIKSAFHWAIGREYWGKSYI